MKVSRLSPTDGTGERQGAIISWSWLRNGIWNLIMFWQYPAGPSTGLLAFETAGWPTLDRYRSVFATLNALCTSTIGSFSGTSALGAAWFLPADNSSTACEVPAAPPSDRSAASNAR